MNGNDLGTYIYQGNIQDLFLNASTKLYNSVAHTIGPKGYNTAIPTNNNFLSIINDGKTILETLSSSDFAEKLALNTLKESSFATNKKAGDGTTSTIVLQHNLLEAIMNYNNTILTDEQMNELPLVDANTVESIRDLLLSKLPNYKKEVTTDEELKNIITVSLGSNKFTDIVFDAFSGISKTQKPALVKVNTQSNTDCIKVDGVSLAPVEINPVVLKTISLQGEEPLKVIILNQEISRLDQAFAGLLQKISRNTTKTILLYTDIKPSVMDQLLYNIQEGALNLIPIRLAMPVTQIDEIIEDLEEYFNCKAFTDLYPYQTNYQQENAFGNGIGYIMNKDSIIIKNDNQEYDKVEHLIPAHSTAIQVGFITFSQQAEDFRRLEDAIQSAYNALNYGYVLGAGYTYFCLGTELEKIPLNAPIVSALQVIFSSLIPDNMDSIQFSNQIVESIYDSYKVAEQVILNSFTVVAQILSTNCLLVPYQRNRITGVLE